MTIDQAWVGSDSPHTRSFGDSSRLDEPACFVDSLEDIINGFRLPGGVYYRELVGPERARLPSIETQVTHVQEQVCAWLGEAVQIASDADFCRDDPDYTATQPQVSYLCEQSSTCAQQYDYWEHNYRQREQNPAGQFVTWATRRAIMPVVKQAVEALTAGHTPKSATDPATLFSRMPGSLANIAKNKEVRSTAYSARMDAKIGLACKRAITPDIIPRLEEYFQLRNDRLEETPDLVGVLTRRQALAELSATWLGPVTVRELEEAMPF